MIFFELEDIIGRNRMDDMLRRIPHELRDRDTDFENLSALIEDDRTKILVSMLSLIVGKKSSLDQQKFCLASGKITGDTVAEENVFLQISKNVLIIPLRDGCEDVKF